MWRCEHFACGGVSTLHVEVCIGVEDLCVLESNGTSIIIINFYVDDFLFFLAWLAFLH